VCSRPFWSTVESLEVVCLTHSLKKCDFLEVYEGESFSVQHGKLIKLLRVYIVYLKTGSRVKTAKEITSIFKIKEGGGLLWCKLSAEIPYLISTRSTNNSLIGIT